MSKSDPKSLSQLISAPNSALGRLARQAASKLALSEHIRTGLPADLAAELLHCSVDENGTLNIRTSGPEWAARFRFEHELLLKLSRERRPETITVQVRVAHPNT